MYSRNSLLGAIGIKSTRYLSVDLDRQLFTFPKDRNEHQKEDEIPFSKITNIETDISEATDHNYYLKVHTVEGELKFKFKNAADFHQVTDALSNVTHNSKAFFQPNDDYKRFNTNYQANRSAYAPPLPYTRDNTTGQVYNPTGQALNPTGPTGQVYNPTSQALNPTGQGYKPTGPTGQVYNPTYQGYNPTGQTNVSNTSGPYIGRSSSPVSSDEEKEYKYENEARDRVRNNRKEMDKNLQDQQKWAEEERKNQEKSLEERNKEWENDQEKRIKESEKRAKEFNKDEEKRTKEEIKRNADYINKNVEGFHNTQEKQIEKSANYAQEANKYSQAANKLQQTQY
jgi:hypothetical protein